MRILHVIHRVVVVFGQSQINVEHVFGIGLAAEQKEAHSIFAGPLNEIAQGDIAASALRNFHFNAAAHHAHHGVQHVVGVALWNASACGLQASAHACNGAVVVGALNVDHFGKAAFPFGNVVGHIGHKVGVGAVAFAHDAVFVIAVVGGLEPQRAILLVGLACFLKLLHSSVNAATGVEA